MGHPFDNVPLMICKHIIDDFRTVCILSQTYSQQKNTAKKPEPFFCPFFIQVYRINVSQMAF
jgi:hypothetical protein